MEQFMTETKNQHYIPRLLLRRFASRSKRDEFFIWCFRKGQPPYEANVNGIAAERYFYGKSTETPIESEMGNRETLYAELLREIASTETITSNQAFQLSDFIAHLMIRTRHLRTGMSQTFEHLFRDVFQQAATHPKTEALISRAIEFQADIKKESLNKQERALREQALKKLMLQELDIDSKIKEIPTMAKQAQVAALEKRHPERTRQLIDLKWSVINTDHLILGDVGLIAYDEENRQFKPGSTFNPESQEYLFLPISPNALIAGSRADHQLKLDENRINLASARLSENFFVSSTNSKAEEDLRASIGMDFEKWSRFHKEKTGYDWPQDLS
jgi:hypothetical protein